MLWSLLLPLACSPDSPDDSGAATSGYLEVDAYLDGEEWAATSPVEGPTPVQAWSLIGEDWIEVNDQIWWATSTQVRVGYENGQDAVTFYVWEGDGEG